MTLQTKFNVGDRVWKARQYSTCFYEYVIVGIPEWYDGSGFNYDVRHEDDNESFEERCNENDLYAYKEDILDSCFIAYVEQPDPTPEDE